MGYLWRKVALTLIKNCIVCPYHTFKYNQKGRLVQIPGQLKTRSGSSFNLKTDVPYYTIICENYWVYLYNQPFFEIYPLNPPAIQDIWIEPESFHGADSAHI